MTWGKKEVEKGRSSTTTPPPDDPLAQVNSSVKTIVRRPRKYLELIFRNELFKGSITHLLILSYTVKKENKIFLIYKEIQSGAVAKSYMRKGFLIYEEMRK